MTTYEYSLLRKDCGKQPLFHAGPAQMLDSIYPDKQLQKEYMLRNPVHRFVQATAPLTQHEVNTKLVKSREQGMEHVEGGWPREIHADHEEQTHRHRRRVMHDESYVNTIKNLAPSLTHYIKQNNAIEMYQSYFSNMKHQESIETYNMRVVNQFRDPFQRPVSCIVWTNEKNPKLAVCYGSNINGLSEPISSNLNNCCHIWDISCQISPLHTLAPTCSCWQLANSPTDPEIFIGGLSDGVINVFDVREGQRPVKSSSKFDSHRGPVTGLLYIHSRTQTEFYTGSPDGQCLWWDTRKITKPVSHLPISVRISSGQDPDLSNAEGVSNLEYNRSLPTRFLVGTESGLVINGNRMGKTHSEILYSYWNAHDGPVRAIHRSACTLRMFITCGDYRVRIWSDEVRTAPIIVTQPFRCQVVDVDWAPQRFSSYMVAGDDGFFSYWDLLRCYHKPLKKLQVSKNGLTKLSPHEEGEFVATGDTAGNLYLLQLSENLQYAGKRDKVLMSQTYERETRREHILDNRVKEIHLKKKAEEELEVKSNIGTEEVDEDEIDKLAEEEYLRVVQEELRNMEIESDTIY